MMPLHRQFSQDCPISFNSLESHLGLSVASVKLHAGLIHEDSIHTLAHLNHGTMKITKTCHVISIEQDEEDGVW